MQPRAQTAESGVRAVVREAGTHCFHCGEPLGARAPRFATVDGEQRTFCCQGCLAVAQIIHAAGLEDFYACRTPFAPPLAAEDTAWEAFDVAAGGAGWLQRDRDGFDCASLLVEGMHCPACVWLIERYLVTQPGIVEASVNYVTRRARLRWDPQIARLSQVLRHVAAIGYRAHPYDPRRREQLARRESRGLLLRAGIALLAMMQVMMLAIPAYLSGDGVQPEYRTLMDWASLALSLPVVGFCAWPFLGGALRDLRARRLGMDVPVALGVVAAFLASAWSTISGNGGAVYYDSVTMFVALLLCARYVEYRAREKAADAIEALAREAPATALKLDDYPRSRSTATVTAQSLAPDDHVLIGAGATVPVDGDVVEGRSSVEEAVLTGESRPCPKSAGAAVLAGSINRDSPLIVRVRAVGDATVLASVARMVEQAAIQRPRAARQADLAASWFVAALLVIVVATGAAWVVLQPARTFEVVLAVLVVSCPCALSLATPAAIATGTAALSRERIVVIRDGTLEALSRVTHVVFDKTGTLTTGELRLQHVEALASRSVDECIAIAATLEQGVAHGAARALCDATPTRLSVRDLAAVPGEGVEGWVEGRRYRIGRPEWVLQLSGVLLRVHSSNAATVVALGDELELIARFELADALRPDAADVVRGLRDLGVRVSMLSGDRAETAGHYGRLVGIDDVRGDLRPQDKRAAIESMQRAGSVVAMVGDGINDAPAMAQADVSLAPGHGANLAKWTAAVAILGGDLPPVIDALRGAREVFRVIRQNLAWALVYNVVAIPLAVAGTLSPVEAAIGMSTSSLLVVGNALRLLRMRGRGGKRRAKAFAATATPAEPDQTSPGAFQLCARSGEGADDDGTLLRT